MEIYYRVLYSVEHFKDWNEGLRTSFHHGTAPEWMRKWDTTQSKAIADYPLVLFTGTYTASARNHFLTTAIQMGGTSNWDKGDVKRSSELDGLCAFITPQGLVEWYTPTSFPAVVVEFEGDFVCTAPDSNTAVVARFVRETRRWHTLEEFKRAFGI